MMKVFQYIAIVATSVTFLLLVDYYNSKSEIGNYQFYELQMRNINCDEMKNYLYNLIRSLLETLIMHLKKYIIFKKRTLAVRKINLPFYFHN